MRRQRIAPELRQNCARGVQVGDVPRVEAEGVGEPLVLRDHRHVHPRLRLLDVRDLGPRLPRRLRVLAVPVVLVDAVRARRHRAVAVLQRHRGQRRRARARRARRRDRRADARRGQHDPRRQRARRREGGEEELGAHRIARRTTLTCAKSDNNLRAWSSCVRAGRRVRRRDGESTYSTRQRRRGRAGWPQAFERESERAVEPCTPRVSLVRACSLPGLQEIGGRSSFAEAPRARATWFRARASRARALRGGMCVLAVINRSLADLSTPCAPPRRPPPPTATHSLTARAAAGP